MPVGKLTVITLADGIAVSAIDRCRCQCNSNPKSFSSSVFSLTDSLSAS